MMKIGMIVKKIMKMVRETGNMNQLASLNENGDQKSPFLFDLINNRKTTLRCGTSISISSEDIQLHFYEDCVEDHRELVTCTFHVQHPYIRGIKLVQQSGTFAECCQQIIEKIVVERSIP